MYTEWATNFTELLMTKSKYIDKHTISNKIRHVLIKTPTTIPTDTTRIVKIHKYCRTHRPHEVYDRNGIKFDYGVDTLVNNKDFQILLNDPDIQMSSLKLNKRHIANLQRITHFNIKFSYKIITTVLGLRTPLMRLADNSANGEAISVITAQIDEVLVDSNKFRYVTGTEHSVHYYWFDFVDAYYILTLTNIEASYDIYI